MSEYELINACDHGFTEYVRDLARIRSGAQTFAEVHIGDGDELGVIARDLFEALSEFEKKYPGLCK